MEWASGAEAAIIVKPLTSRGELARKLKGAGADRRSLKLAIDPMAELIRKREQDGALNDAGVGV